MPFFESIIVIAQTMAIYLGVGSSTIAILSFFAAIQDNQITPQERKLLGVIYWVLRFSMILITITTAVIHVYYPTLLPSSLLTYIWILVAVLFLNAGLMTARVMPSRFGPAIQAATWYTLGFLVTIVMFNLYDLTPLLFWSLYIGDIIVMVVSVNACMWYLKHHAQQSPTTQ